MLIGWQWRGLVSVASRQPPGDRWRGEHLLGMEERAKSKQETETGGGKQNNNPIMQKQLSICLWTEIRAVRCSDNGNLLV